MDRMLINKAALTDDGPTGPPGGAAPSGAHPGFPGAQTIDMGGANPEQAGFMASLEQDAQERFERRQKKQAEAAVLKEKGNTAFKGEDYDQAIELYDAAIRLDPANALLYTNCAQAHLKQGNFEAALERCDWAIRADERCFKAYLRQGIALRSLGEYGKAVDSFKQGRKLVPKDQRKTFDRHIDECAVAQKIAASEQQLTSALESGEHDDAIKAIERGASRLALPALKPAEYLAATGELIRQLRTPIHQDLFRLRKGMRLVADAALCVAYVASLGKTATGDATELHMQAACTSATFRVLAAAAKGNEAACRELFKDGAKDAMIMASILAHGAEAVRAECLAALMVAVESAQVRRTLAQPSCEDLVVGLINAFESPQATVRSRVDAAVCFSFLSTEPVFQARCRRLFAEEVYPQLGGLLDMGGALAEAGLLALTNLAGDAAIRRQLADDDVLSELFGFVEGWSHNVLTGTAHAGVNHAAVLYKLLGLLMNVTIEPAAMPVLQQPASLDCVIALLDYSTESVFARAAALIARACTSKLVAEHLVFHGGAQRLIELAEAYPDDPDFLDAVARTAAKMVPLYPASRGVVASERALRIWCKMLLNKSEKVVGNAALCISECAKDQQVCMELVGTTVVADLLKLARRDKSKLTENCAIALARLASGHPEHIGRLRQLGGFEVLHSRAPKSN